MSKRKNDKPADTGNHLPDDYPGDAPATMVADGNADQSAADRMPQYSPCVQCSIRPQDGDPDHLCDHCRQEAAHAAQSGESGNGERRKISRPRTNPVQFWVALLDEYGYPKTLIVRTKSVRSARRKLEEYSRALGILRDAMCVIRVKPVKDEGFSSAAA